MVQDNIVQGKKGFTAAAFNFSLQHHAQFGFILVILQPFQRQRNILGEYLG